MNNSHVIPNTPTIAGKKESPQKYCHHDKLAWLSSAYYRVQTQYLTMMSKYPFLWHYLLSQYRLFVVHLLDSFYIYAVLWLILACPRTMKNSLKQTWKAMLYYYNQMHFIFVVIPSSVFLQLAWKQPFACFSDMTCILDRRAEKSNNEFLVLERKALLKNWSRYVICTI